MEKGQKSRGHMYRTLDSSRWGLLRFQSLCKLFLSVYILATLFSGHCGYLGQTLQ